MPDSIDTVIGVDGRVPTVCPYCGKSMVIFDEETQTYVCANCGTVIQHSAYVRAPSPFSKDPNEEFRTIPGPNEVHRAQTLVYRYDKHRGSYFEVIDLTDILADSIISEASIRMLIRPSPQIMKDIIDTAYVLADYIVSNMGDFTINQRVAAATCLAEAILDAKRILYDEKKCKTSYLNSKFQEVLSQAMTLAKRYATPVPRQLFATQLIQYGIVRHPLEQILLASQDAYNMLSALIGNFNLKRVKCSIAKLKHINFIRNVGLIDLRRCGGQFNYGMAKNYVVQLARDLGQEYGKLAMTSAFTRNSAPTTIYVPEPIADIIDMYYRINEVPDFWIYSDQAVPESRRGITFDLTSTISDLGILMHDFRFYYDGEPFERLFADDKKVGLRVESLPAIKMIITKYFNKDELTHQRSLAYTKIFIGGALLLRVFLKHNYPELLGYMTHFKLVTDMMKKHISIRYTKNQKDLAEAVRVIIKNPSKASVLKYRMVRVSEILPRRRLLPAF